MHPNTLKFIEISKIQQFRAQLYQMNTTLSQRNILNTSTKIWCFNADFDPTKKPCTFFYKSKMECHQSNTQAVYQHPELLSPTFWDMCMYVYVYIVLSFVVWNRQVICCTLAHELSSSRTVRLSHICDSLPSQVRRYDNQRRLFVLCC